MSKEIAESVKRKHEKLKGMRVNWDSHWEEVATFIQPRKDDIYGSDVRGEKKGNRLYNNTSVQANEDLASALHGMLTNPATIWFGLSSGSEELDADKEVMNWLQDTAKRLIKAMNNSNFQTEVHDVYLDLGSFGTSHFRVEDDDELIVRFASRPIYESYILENYKGVVDTVSYEYKQTLRQLAQEFGYKNLDPALQELYQQDSMKEVIIIHLVRFP